MVYGEMTTAALGEDLADLRYDHYTSEANIDRMKRVLAKWQEATATFLRVQLLRQLPVAAHEERAHVATLIMSRRPTLGPVRAVCGVWVWCGWWPVAGGCVEC
eukprot:scaffold25009_cov128-Isochrysis_galbana.AAC.2